MSRSGQRVRRPVGVECDGWTGFEINKCCELAWTLQCTVKEAAAYIVPVCLADSEGVDMLQGMATGRFLSASTPGPYRRPNKKAAKGARRIAAVGGD